MIKNKCEWLGMHVGSTVKVIADSESLDSIGLDNTYSNATGTVTDIKNDEVVTVSINGLLLKFELDMIEWCDPLVNNNQELVDDMWKDYLKVN